MSSTSSEHSGPEDSAAVRQPLLLAGNGGGASAPSAAAGGTYASAGSSPPVISGAAAAAAAASSGAEHHSIDISLHPGDSLITPLLQSSSWVWRVGRSTQAGSTTLTRQSLSFTQAQSSRGQSAEKVTHLPLEDVVGVLRSADGSSLLVHSYPRRQGCCCGSGSAERTHELTTLSLGAGGDAALLDTWHRTLQALLQHAWVHSSMHSAADGDQLRPRRLLFLINPASGSGGAARNLAAIEPMLAHSGIPYSVMHTTHANHAKEFAAALDPRAPGTPTDLVCISGDGLVHEVVNGLMQRPDWASVTRQVRLGHIGGGSGNGLASAVCAGSGEPISLLSSAFLVLKGASRPFDLFSVKQEDEPVRFGFLSMSYGLVSDIDLESESMRYLGNARFTVTALKRMVNLRRYDIDMEYLPADEEQKQDGAAAASSKVVPKCATGEEGCAICGLEGYSSGSVAGQRAFVHSGRAELQQYLAQVGGAAAAAAVPAPAADADAAVAASAVAPAAAAADAGEWKQLSDSYCLVWVMNATHAASDMHVAPTAHYSSGLLELYSITRIPRLSMLSLFLGMEQGTHTTNPYITCTRVRALRMKPRDARISQLTADGERLPYKPLEARCFKGVINLLAK